MKKRATSLAAIALAGLLTTVGCAGGVGAGSQGGGGGGEGLPQGASKEDYQAAFEDLDPINLKVQDIAPSADSPAGQATVNWLDEVEEWSGGKITFDIAWNNSIASVDEVPDALRDGRLDIAQWSLTFFDDEIPAFKALRDSLISVPSSPLQGEILTHFVAQEVAFKTPEIMAEFEEFGVVPLNPHDHYASSALACTKEKNSTADFKGDQIRINADTLDPQINALGGTALAVDTGEVYEALQRGQLNCIAAAASSYNGYGWVDAAPHVYLPENASFVPGPGGKFAGASWERLPLVAQQLIFDRLVTYNASVLAQDFAQQIEGVERTAAGGGTIQYLDSESSKLVEKASEGVLEEVRNSSTLDGEQLVNNVSEAIDTWTARLDELGYKDGGSFQDFPEWYEGSADASSLDYTMAAAEALFEEVLSSHRPE
jgi:TRAP-type C4-dicarboxylate transport system substrate-binding protein